MIRPSAPEAAAASASGQLRTTQRSLLERLLPALGWCAVGAAAMVITMLLLNLREVRNDQPKVTSTNPTTAETGRVKPIATHGEILTASDEGIYESDDQGPARVVRYESVERREWTDDTGAITIVEVPREDVFTVPVAFQ